MSMVVTARALESDTYDYIDASYSMDVVARPSGALYRPVPATEVLPVDPARRRDLARALQLGAKRALDIALALTLLVLLAPVMALAAIAIKLDSAGPVCFNRVRTGKDGASFTMYKFRTMHADAEARLARLQHLNAGGAHMIKIANDPRVTRVGKILRASSIDELPQLLNVLTGEMSLVGPRPQTPEEVALYTDEQRRRLVVKPGITGLWQVRDRHNPSFEQWIYWDLTYVAEWSLWLDLRIAGATIAMILVDIWAAVGRRAAR